MSTIKAKLAWVSLILLTFVGGFSIGSASAIPYQVFLNGTPAKIKPIRDKDSLIVPLSLPVSSDQEEWNISFRRDTKAHTLKIETKAVRRKLRGDNDCYYCTATGKCSQDSPVGSGLNYAGTTEYICSGTGKCIHCGGSGQR